MRSYQRYLTTLRRVPDDIVLAVASREILPTEPNACLCGWFMRERVARMTDVAAEAVHVHSEDMRLRVEGTGTPARCATVFGGTREEWYRIFADIGHVDDVERAFVERVLEAVPS